MIIKARHHPILYPFIQLYTVLKIRRHFNSVLISGDFQEKNLPLLLLSNHVSWWDGFWVMYLNLKLFHRKFNFMMLEEQLRRYSIFMNTGGYSVNKGTRSIIESINYTVELLSDSNNLVLLFPQGKITSIYDRSFLFERGIERIIKEIKGKTQIIFVANLVDYFSNEKPTLYIYFKEYDLGDHKIEKIQENYSIFYSECIANNTKKAEY